MELGWYKLKFLTPNSYVTKFIYVHKFNGDVTVGGGAASDNYLWFQWEPQDRDARLDKVSFNPTIISSVTPTATGLRLGIAKPVVGSETLELVDIITVPYDYLTPELDLRPYEIIIPSGYSVAVYAAKVADGTGLYTFQSGEPYPGAPRANYFVPSAGVGSRSARYPDPARFSYRIDYSVLVPRDEEETEETIVNKIDVDDLTTVMFMGSSLTSAHYQPGGSSFLERLNDLTDLNLVNNAITSKNLLDNINTVNANEPISKDDLNTPTNLKPKYIWWGNSANGTPEGLLGFRQLLVAKEVSDSYGATMILGSEEDYANKAKTLEATYKSFGEQYNVPYSPILQIWRKCFPNSNPYPGWLGGGHAGYRALAPYIAHKELLDCLYIHKNVKLFKVRPMYKEGSPTIDDLRFDDIMGRNKYFNAICSGVAANVNTAHADSLESSLYDVPNGSYGGTTTSETSVLQRRGAITFNKFSLIEFISDKVKTTRFNFSITASVQPLNVYLAVTKNIASIPTNAGTEQNDALDAIRTTYLPISFNYNSETKNLTATIIADDYNFQLYDKIRIIIQAPTSFTLSEPRIYNYDGIDKPIQPQVNPRYSYRKFGLELNSNIAFPLTGHGWTLAGGSLIAELPENIANYTGYTTQKSHLEMPSDTSTATKSIPITQPTRKVAVRIAVCNWRPIATTRFIGTEIETSPYIDATKPVYTRYEYDYTELQMTVNNQAVRRALVQTGWSELYFEVDVDPADASLSVKLERRAFVDSSYTNDVAPMFIHAVSVQKID